MSELELPNLLRRRWFQGQSDFGNPLTVIDWLTKLRANPAAPFVPGAMIDWEVRLPCRCLCLNELPGLNLVLINRCR